MLQAHLKSFFLSFPDRGTIWVAYSGGMDSHVLLSLCQELREELQLDLRVTHINHGINPNATQWGEHCRKVCALYDLPLTTHQVNWQISVGESLEAKARKLRYDYWQQLLSANDLLLTAHHEEDQAETLLVQLCRGAGIKGLAAMPDLKKLGIAKHARPLLQFSRKALLNYANEKKLSWIHDHSNDDTKHTRNFFRHSVLPILQERWPNISHTLARSAAHCAESSELLKEAHQQTLRSIVDDKNRMNLLLLQNYSASLQKILLRQWIENSGYQLPSQKMLTTMLSTMLTAANDKTPMVEWQGIMLRRYRNHLYLTPVDALLIDNGVLSWDFSGPLIFAGIGILQCKKIKDEGLSVDIRTVLVRFGNCNEKVKLFGRTHHHSLKKLFQIWGVPPWQRHKIPLLFHNEILIAAVGYFTEKNFSANKQSAGHVIFLET